MTTTYKTTEFETADALREAINSDLSQLAYPYTVKHKVYGEGQLTFVKAPLIGGGLYATIDFAAGTKTLSLDVVLANQMLEMPEALAETLLEAQTAFKADFLAREQAKREADRVVREQAREAEKQAKAEKEAEEAYQRAKARNLKDFEAMEATVTPKSFADEFYYALGWMVNNTGVFSAAMPDYLLSHFERHFGTEAKPQVVDSRKRTVNGHPMQWALSMKASIKKNAVDTVPACLRQHLNKTGNAFSDTSFIWNLVDNYGFQFGKKVQDVDKIRSCVPASHISFFEAGLSA